MTTADADETESKYATKHDSRGDEDEGKMGGHDADWHVDASPHAAAQVCRCKRYVTRVYFERSTWLQIVILIPHN